MPLVTLYPSELKLVKEAAKQYEKKTGDPYNFQIIIYKLANIYMENFEKDLESVMNQKKIEYEKEQAGKGKQV